MTGPSAHTAQLDDFVAAVVGDDPVRAEAARAAMVDTLGMAWLVDVCAVIANFEMMTRLADGTGARMLPEQITARSALFEELGLLSFPSARL